MCGVICDMFILLAISQACQQEDSWIDDSE